MRALLYLALLLVRPGRLNQTGMEHIDIKTQKKKEYI